MNNESHITNSIEFLVLRECLSSVGAWDALRNLGTISNSMVTFPSFSTQAYLVLLCMWKKSLLVPQNYSECSRNLGKAKIQSW